MGQDDKVNNAMMAAAEMQKSIHHTPIKLGINEFKRMVRERFGSSKVQNRLISAFKKRAWMEYEGIARDRGNFPTHMEYGIKVHIGGPDETEETIRVNVV